MLIDLRHDRIVIDGVTILRPSRLAPSQWMKMWEGVVRWLQRDGQKIDD